MNLNGRVASAFFGIVGSIGKLGRTYGGERDRWVNRRDCCLAITIIRHMFQQRKDIPSRRHMVCSIYTSGAPMHPAAAAPTEMVVVQVGIAKRLYFIWR